VLKKLGEKVLVVRVKGDVFTRRSHGLKAGGFGHYKRNGFSFRFAHTLGGFRTTLAEMEEIMTDLATGGREISR